MSADARVLAVVAHPDDESWCSGLLAAQVDAGLEVHLAVACNGDMGGMPDREPAQRARVRRGEMERAVAVIGCALHWMDVGDGEFMDRYTGDYTALEWQFRNIIRRTDPELLIVPHPEDYHHHHRAVSELALNASANAANASLQGEVPPASGVPMTLFMQPLPPCPFTPDLYADVTATLDRKMEALRCHKSQHPFLKDHHRTDLVALARLTASLHGAACAVQYAEAYSVCRRFNRVGTVQALARFFP